MLISSEMLERAGIKVEGKWDEWLPTVRIDSRLIEKGDLFWALKGEHADGNDFVAAAFESGARIAAVSEDWATQNAGNLPEKTVLFTMPDTLAGMQRLAMEVRRSIGASTIALTGSNGKSMTKELMAAAMGAMGTTTATRGNLNNHIGLPLTVLNATGEEAFLVLEMGANHVGEIDLLCQIAHPEIGLITNIGDAHVGEFGGFEALQKAKGELFESIKDDGLAIVNLDDDRVVELASNVSRKAGYTLGLGRIPEDWTQPIYFGEIISQDEWSRTTLRIEGEQVKLQLVGAHWASAALAAVAVAMESGGEADAVVPALATVEALPGRGNIVELGEAFVELLDDSYNANVASIEAALLTLSRREGMKVAVLGDVMELGEFQEDEHRRIGRIPDLEQMDHLVFVGERMSWAAEEAMFVGHPSVRSFIEADMAEVAEYVNALLEPGTGVLVKGSRKVGLERVVDAIRKMR